MLLGTVTIANDQMLEQLEMRIDVAVEVHGHEAGKLNEPRIDLAHEARIHHRHPVDYRILEPLQRPGFGKLVDRGRVLARIDGPPISVMVLGTQRSPAAAMSDTAANTGTDG